jgi:hypothetical protein
VKPKVRLRERNTAVFFDVSEPATEINFFAVHADRAAQFMPHADDSVAALHRKILERSHYIVFNGREFPVMNSPFYIADIDYCAFITEFTISETVKPISLFFGNYLRESLAVTNAANKRNRLILIFVLKIVSVKFHRFKSPVAGLSMSFPSFPNREP